MAIVAPDPASSVLTVNHQIPQERYPIEGVCKNENQVALPKDRVGQ